MLTDEEIVTAAILLDTRYVERDECLSSEIDCLRRHVHRMVFRNGKITEIWAHPERVAELAVESLRKAGRLADARHAETLTEPTQGD